MNKKLVAVYTATFFLFTFVYSIIFHHWDMNDEPTKVTFGLTNEILMKESINYQLFETWGPVLFVLGILMFGAMIAGICISKEERNEGGDLRSQ